MEVNSSLIAQPQFWGRVCGSTLAMCLLSFSVIADGNAAEGTSENTDQEITTASSSDAAQSSPAELIMAMTRAMRALNYEGYFVHVQGTALTSLHVLHASEESSGEFEWLSELGGERRETFRNNSLVVCARPDTQELQVKQAMPRHSLPRVHNLARDHRYTFSFGQPDRVAGRLAHVVNVVPRDVYRYGHRFWVDSETDMLLRSMLLDGPENPVEQIIFTDISFPDSVDLSRFDVNKRFSQQSVPQWPDSEGSTSVAATATAEPLQSEVVDFSSLPEGYRKVSETVTQSSDENVSAPTRHVMLTDGMASVSVYVEFMDASSQPSDMLGLSRMGAMNAFGVSTSSALVTAVGDVPSATVQAIANAVELSE